MTHDVDIKAFNGTDLVYAIAAEVFSTMIDGEGGYLTTWGGSEPALPDAVHAWVDVRDAMIRRILLSTEQRMARRITRALLGMDADAAVGDVDLVDALGEVANVVGGNVRALVNSPGAMGIPKVAHERPLIDPDFLLHALTLDWRGAPLVISLWSLP
jgi:chemotaxis protein CheX